MNDTSYLLIGGDKRQDFLFNILKSENKNVSRIFFNDTENLSDAMKKINSSNIIILPIPSTKDGVNIYAPHFKEAISLDLIVNNISDDTILFLGGENDIFKKAKAKTINLLSFESLTLKNAMVTAEAALAIIIQNTNKTIFGSEILITGYGRIGKILSNYLISLKANVTVCARKESARLNAELSGAKSLDFENLKTTLQKFEIIINTIPSLIFKKDELKTINSQALIIDLASKPGGIDFNIANELGLNTIHALALPGIYSPKSAAEFIAQTINSALT